MILTGRICRGDLPSDLEGRVYIVHAPGTLACLNLGDGSNVWSAALSSEPPAAGDWPAPLVRRDGIGVILPGGRVALCDPADGRKNWLAATGDDQARHLLRWRNVLVVSGKNVTALDARSGTVLWRQAGAGAGQESALVVSQGKAAAMTGNGALLNLTDGAVVLKDAFGPGTQGSCLFQSSSATLFAVLAHGKSWSVEAFQVPREGERRWAWRLSPVLAVVVLAIGVWTAATVPELPPGSGTEIAASWIEDDMGDFLGGDG